jgi:hypothetical protein
MGSENPHRLSRARRIPKSMRIEVAERQQHGALPRPTAASPPPPEPEPYITGIDWQTIAYRLRNQDG